MLLSAADGMLVKTLFIQYLFYVMIRAPVMLIFEMEKYDSGYNLALCYAQMHSYDNNNNDKILLDTTLPKVFSKAKINNKTETRSIRFAIYTIWDVIHNHLTFHLLSADWLTIDIYMSHLQGAFSAPSNYPNDQFYLFNPLGLKTMDV